VTLAIVLIVLWLFWTPAVLVVALIQHRSPWLAVAFALLLGPFALSVVPRLPPGGAKSAGWYPYWYPRYYRRRFWDGQAWTDDFTSAGIRTNDIWPPDDPQAPWR
jgi:hypothetical protein